MTEPMVQAEAEMGYYHDHPDPAPETTEVIPEGWLAAYTDVMSWDSGYKNSPDSATFESEASVGSAYPLGAARMYLDD